MAEFDIQAAKQAEAKAQAEQQDALDQMARMRMGAERKEQERQLKIREQEQAKRDAEEAERQKTIALLQDKKRTKCGQPNLHWTGENPMTCELPKGHAGNHQALYTKAGVDAVVRIAVFTDEAGLPVPEPN